jgi:hypothetical protein
MIFQVYFELEFVDAFNTEQEALECIYELKFLNPELGEKLWIK